MKALATTLRQRLGRTMPLSWLMARSGERVYRPMYHTVQGDYDLPHIRHLYTPHTLARFESDLDYMLRFFDPISLDELPAAMAGERNGRPALFLSFDDALREVFEFAYPVLAAKGVPATVFVNSAFVDNRRLFFRFMASALVDRLKTGQYSSPVLAEAGRVLFRTDTADRGNEASAGDTHRQHLPSDKAMSPVPMNDTKHLVKAVLAIDYARRETLEQLADVLEFDAGHFLREQRPYMTRTQLQTLLDNGFSLGAHSVDHPRYRQLPLDEQLRQTTDSMDYVEQQFSVRPCSFAFPFGDNGVRREFFSSVLSNDRLSLVFGTAGFRSDIDERIIHRHPQETGIMSASERMADDYFNAVLRKAIGKYPVMRAA